MRTSFKIGSLTVGHFISEFATPGIGQIVKPTGIDYLVFDMEHTGFGYETAKRTVVAARAGGMPIVVRVPSFDYKDLARACDIGADGLMVPMVPNAAAAREIVRCTKYHPDGQRGVSMGSMHDRYLQGEFVAKAAAANAHIAIIAQIESGEGADNAEAIAAVPGIDCLWMGHMDLSCSLGIPTQFDAPQFQRAVRQIVDGAHRNGKAAGRLCRTAEEGAAQHKAGFDTIALAGDVFTYQSALARNVAELRSRATGA